MPAIYNQLQCCGLPAHLANSAGSARGDTHHMGIAVLTGVSQFSHGSSSSMMAV